MRRDLVGAWRGSLSILSAPIRAAEISAKAPGCIVALNGSAADVTVGSAAAITTDNCAAGSNASVPVLCGTTITTKTANYDWSAAPSLCTGPTSIQPPAGMA